ncbi:helix-turn-helix transcriptional regulator [Tannockella kyphosi]|uniref:helix-turn-helix transcriptional regulator n=1 Tax=Tannockella kyphosi TaxID=2899121 RepID=UPI002011D15F|nr:HTH domain-containing protein [Tannockella kyphosi]
MKNRQLELLIHLLKIKKSTYKELSKKFEVSTKTIERDIDRLALAGIPVYCQQGAGGGVNIDEDYKFTNSFFTPHDIGHLVTALHMARSFTANPRNQEVLQKLSLIAPNLTTMYQQNVTNYFYIDNPAGPVDFSKGIYELINYCLDFKEYALINGKDEIVCLGYVFKSDKIYLFSYLDDYQLINIADIITFEATGKTISEEYMSYHEYREKDIS